MTDADTTALAARLMREAATLDIDHPPIIPRDETGDSTDPRADEGTEGPRAPAVGLDLTPELAVLRALLWHVPAVDQERARLDALAVADATEGGAIMAQALVRMAPERIEAARTWREDDGA